MENQHSLFQKIKPICVNIAKDCSIENINELELVLSDADETSISALQEYLLFPFRLLLCKELNEKLTIRSIDFMRFLFKKNRISSWSVFSSTFLQLFNLLSVPSEIDKIRNISEELKSSICLCIITLTENAIEEILIDMFNVSFRLSLAQGFYTLIGLLKNERSKVLRQIILQTIGVLIGESEYLKPWSTQLKDTASNALASFLPGLCVALMNVVSGDIKQGQSVMKMAVNLLGKLIVLVVGDHAKCSDRKISHQSDVPCVVKNEAWFQEVAVKLQIVVNNTILLANHDQWKARMEFLTFAELILCCCTERLEKCATILLPAIFALSVDVNDQVSLCSKNLIYKYSCQFQAANSLSLNSVIKDDLYALSSKLFKSKLSSSDDEKLLILRSIQGYIQILLKSVDNLLFSIPHLEKLILSLINLLEFDTTKVNLVEEVTVKWNMSSVPQKWPKKYFMYFHKEDILITVSSICHCLGENGCVRLLIDYLVEQLPNYPLFSSQIIFLMGCVIEGLSEKAMCKEESKELIGDIIEEILSPAMWELPLQDCTVSLYYEQSDSQQHESYCGSNLYQICIILEVIEKCARVLGKEFQGLLKRVLFSVMERAGHSHYLLSQCGKLCLYSIAQSCGYTSVVELVRENADYLVNSVTLNFHHFLLRPEMATVLRAVMEESDSHVLYLFKDCIYHILNILDLNHDKPFLLMIVLKSIAISIRRLFPPTQILNVPEKNVEDLQNFFLERRLKQKSQEDFFEDGNADEMKEDDDQDTNKEKMPLHVNMATEILKRCVHLQSSRNIYIRVISLEIAELCILTLGDFRNQLDPLIHELWNPFIRRFSEEPIVILEAFKILLVIAEECKDFVRVRTLQDLMPKFINFLKDNFSSSLLKNNFRNYQWTNMCKLQLCLLSNIGNLVSKLDISEKEVALLAEVCLPYLKNQQPKLFQEAAFKTIETLINIDPDAMWLYYHEMYSKEQTLIPPHESLHLLNFPYSNNSDTDFKINFNIP